MPDQTLETLFYPSDLAGTPRELSFVYSIPEAAFFVEENHRVTPYNALSALPITWEMARDADWLAISAVTGTTPDHSFHLTPTDFDRTAEGDYAGNVIVRDTVTAEEEMIAVTLQVTNRSFYRIYLSRVLR